MWGEGGNLGPHIVCEALASLRHAHLGSFLEPEDIRRTGLGAIWAYSKATGLPCFDMGHKGPDINGLDAWWLRGPNPKDNQSDRHLAKQPRVILVRKLHCLRGQTGEPAGNHHWYPFRPTASPLPAENGNPKGWSHCVPL